MFNYLNENKMTEQARTEGKTYSPFALVLIYFAVMIIVNVVTNIVMTPVLILLLSQSFFAGLLKNAPLRAWAFAAVRSFRNISRVCLQAL